MNFAVTACVLLRRRDTGSRTTWLLSVRRDDAGYAPGRIGLIGGHVELADGPSGVLEDAARREAREEAGIDLSAVALHYLASLRYAGALDEPSVDVTFAADAPPGLPVRLAAPTELSAVGWWSLVDLASDPRTPPWLPELVEAADRLLDSLLSG